MIVFLRKRGHSSFLLLFPWGSGPLDRADPSASADSRAHTARVRRTETYGNHIIVLNGQALPRFQSDGVCGAGSVFRALGADSVLGYEVHDLSVLLGTRRNP